MLKWSVRPRVRAFLVFTAKLSIYIWKKYPGWILTQVTQLNFIECFHCRLLTIKYRKLDRKFINPMKVCHVKVLNKSLLLAGKNSGNTKAIRKAVESFLRTTLWVQVEQWIVCVCDRTIPFALNNLRPTYLACWFTLTLSRSRSKVKVVGQSSHSQDESCSFFG